MENHTLTYYRPTNPQIIHIDIEEAKRLHHEEKKTMKEIAEIFGVKDFLVQRKLSKAGVQLFNYTHPKYLPTKAELEKLYIQELHSMNEISKMYDTSVPTIRKLLKKFDIPKRDFAIQQKHSYKKIIEHNKKTYGVPYLFQTDDFKEKANNTKIEKYGTTQPQLFKNTSKTEKEVKSFIESISAKSFDKNHKILNGKEIDLYNDELKLGIEYCGLYFHNEKSRSPRLRAYHYEKWKGCEAKGVRLITIFEDEWLNRKDQVKAYLTSILSNKQTIRGNKTEVKEITKGEASEFCEKYHIQGKPSNLILFSFGLFLKNTAELIGVMTFSKHHRKTDNNSIVLSRLCFSPDYRIHGGASKLFSYALPHLSEYDSIISWSDNRWSRGNVYQKMGFILDANIPQDYSYVNLGNCSENRVSKQSMTKKKMGAREGQTEKERAEELGFARIWDCGKKRWLFPIHK